MGPTPNIPILYCESDCDKVFNLPDWKVHMEFCHDLGISWVHLTQRFMWNFTMTSVSVELTWPKGSCGILSRPRHQLSSPDPKTHVEFYHDLSISWAHLTQRFMWNFTMTSALVELTWPKGSCGILPWPQYLLSSPDPKVHVEFCHDLSISWSQPDFKDHVRSCHHLGVCFDPDSCLMLTNRFV